MLITAASRPARPRSRPLWPGCRRTLNGPPLPQPRPIPAIELVTDRATKATFGPTLKLNERVKETGFARGLAVYPMGGTVDGQHGDHICIAPPYVATRSDIDTIAERLGDAVDDAIAGLPKSC
jgi:hypothetical protein